MKDKEKSFSRKLFNFFNPNKDGKGVSKDEKPLVPNLKNMPKFYIRNFSRLLTLNVLMIVLLVPAAVAMYMYSVGSTTPSQESTVYSTLYGSNLLMPSAPLMAFLGIFGQQLDLHVSTPRRYIHLSDWRYSRCSYGELCMSARHIVLAAW